MSLMLERILPSIGLPWGKSGRLLARWKIDVPSFVGTSAKVEDNNSYA